MIPYLYDFVEMHAAGDLRAWEIVAYVVKYIAQNGAQVDFDDLPEWIKSKIVNRLEQYKQEGGWFVLSSSEEMEDYGRYADIFLSKVRIDASR